MIDASQTRVHMTSSGNTTLRCHQSFRMVLIKHRTILRKLQNQKSKRTDKMKLLRKICNKRNIIHNKKLHKTIKSKKTTILIQMKAENKKMIRRTSLKTVQ